MTTPVTIPGHGAFKSINEAAKVIDIPYTTFKRMLKRDKPIEQQIADHKATIKGLNIPGYGQFKSITEAAKAIGISRCALGRALRNNRPIEKVLNPHNKPRPVKIGEKQYKSILEATRETGFSYTIINNAIKYDVLDRPALIKKGFTHTTSKPIKIRFNKFPSIREAHRQTGISRDTLRLMLNAPQEHKDLLGLKNRDGKRLIRGMPIKCFNRLYPSQREFCRVHNVSKDAVNRYLDNGIPLEQLFNPNKINKGKEIMFYNKLYPSKKFLADLLEVAPATLNRHIENNTLTSLVDDEDRWRMFINKLKNINWKRDVELKYEPT